MSHKRHRVPATRFKQKPRYCPEVCKFMYRGIERDSNGRLLREFDCRTHCRRRFSA